MRWPPTTAWGYFLESSQTTLQQGRRTQTAQWASWVKKTEFWVLESQGSQNSQGRNQEERLLLLSSEEGSPQFFISILISTFVRKFIEATLKPPEFCKNCQRSTRLKRIYITTARVEKLHNTQDIMLSTWSILPRYWGNISLIQIKFKCKDIKTAIINISHTINKVKE